MYLQIYLNESSIYFIPHIKITFPKKRNRDRMFITKKQYCYYLKYSKISNENTELLAKSLILC